MHSLWVTDRPELLELPESSPPQTEAINTIRPITAAPIRMWVKLGTSKALSPTRDDLSANKRLLRCTPGRGHEFPSRANAHIARLLFAVTQASKGSTRFREVKPVYLNRKLELILELRLTN